MDFTDDTRRLFEKAMDLPCESMADLIDMLADYCGKCSECGQSNGWRIGDDRELAGLFCDQCEERINQRPREVAP